MNWEDLKGNPIKCGDTLVSLFGAKVEVVKLDGKLCIKNCLGDIIPFDKLIHSLKHPNRLMCKILEHKQLELF